MKDEIYDLQFFLDIRRVCEYGYRNFWHEGNGGNLSYRLTEDERKEVRSYLEFDASWIPLNINLEELRNQQFVVTGTGVYFMDCYDYPEKSFCIIELNDLGTAYRILLNKENVKPTSELSAHLLTHKVKVKNGIDRRCVYHAHTTNLIASTFILPLNSIEFTKTLWRMSSEMAVVFPEGIGLLDWMVPGIDDIGFKTSELMEEKNVVVWANHGTFVSALDAIKAFGLMSTVEKAAMIYMKLANSGMKIRQTITDENLEALAKRFKVNLSREIE